MRARGTNRKSALACRTESVIAFFQMRGTRDKFPAPVTAPEARSDAFIERDYRYVADSYQRTKHHLPKSMRKFGIGDKVRVVGIRSSLRSGCKENVF